MIEQEVVEYRKSLAIRFSGFDVPRPVKTFEDCGLAPELIRVIAKQGYEKPTTIQCQALSIVLSGRDVIADLQEGGPIGMICAPTREIAHQIFLEAKKFVKAYGIRTSTVYGGMSKLDQFKELKEGCEIVVATPGRLIDVLKMKALTMTRATYLVIDEADRMFDLGFEPQINRQTLLFSATMPRKVEKLAREILSDPIRVTVGEMGTAKEDITHHVHVISSDSEKLPWLLEKLPGMIDEGDVLIRLLEWKLYKFKSVIYHVLIATDVVARGLDIKSIKSVVNYDIAKDMDMHVHRIGRTGRAGDKDGITYALITQKEAWFAGELVNSLIVAGQNVSTELMDLAMKEERQRKGWWRGGRGVCGVDYGLGIGYNMQSSNASSQAVRSQNAAVNSLKTGMMAQMKSNFVAASSNPHNSHGFNSSSSIRGPSLFGFVFGGTIGGDINSSRDRPRER
ncbi:DEAD-box ATP-dependent RNA helicase 24 [Hibiscus syriacus]|uniref:RNA helicase n=1 Tax=Hibiscus syriacus TaxID=106335 RepID=A0A6A2WH45_HIBSY|nr:DEAD-box ATP-dependent RNA helicase 24 [Hibiscus syriacus]